MKISEKKKSALYKAIYEPIMELRVEIGMAVKDGKPISTEGLDELLYRIPEQVWNDQKRVLNIVEN